MITTEQIRQLRAETGLSMMQCKDALEQAGGDKDKAIAILKEKGAAIASKKADRNLGAGVVASYIHAGDSVGAMLELLCETDFVSKNPEFKAVAREIAMQVAAMNPETAEELLEQPFIKGSGETIRDIINNTVQKFGERTEIGRIIRFSIK